MKMASMLPMKLLLASTIIGVILYYGNLPVPEAFESSPDRWVMRFLAAGTDFLKFLENMGLTNTAVTWENVMISFRGAWGATNVTFADTTFDGVNVRVYQPRDMKYRKEMVAGLVFIHGGGWIYGNADSYHGVTVYIASKLHVMLVSIDYGKGPQHPFPAALEDCTKATVWFLQNARRLNVNPSRIAVVGEGAGGNLAAAVVQRLRLDEEYGDITDVKLQVLFYPLLQAFDFQTPSYQQNGYYITLLFTSQMSARSWCLYMEGNGVTLVEEFISNNHTSSVAKTSSSTSRLLSHDKIPEHLKHRSYVKPLNSFGNENIYNRTKIFVENPDFSPLLRDNLTGLPETYIVIGEFDVARDENILFADRLEKSGVKVNRKYYDLGIHNMLSYFIEPLVLTDGRKCMQDFLNFVRHSL